MEHDLIRRDPFHRRRKSGGFAEATRETGAQAAQAALQRPGERRDDVHRSRRLRTAGKEGGAGGEGGLDGMMFKSPNLHGLCTHPVSF